MKKKHNESSERTAAGEFAFVDFGRSSSLGFDDAGGLAAAVVQLYRYALSDVTFMKKCILIVLSCVPALAEDTGVRLLSTVATTNSLGIYTTETFIRGGHTNLVRMIGVKDSAVVYASHSFFHGGNLVATSIGTPSLSSFHTRDGLPYQVGLEFWPSKDVRGLHINGKDFNEMFHATNGVFYPAADSELGIKDHKK